MCVIFMLPLCNCRDAARFRASGPVYEELLEKASAMRGPCHGCPVCERAFTDTQEFKVFEQKVFHATHAESQALLHDAIVEIHCVAD